jgi:hypothetical protein
VNQVTPVTGAAPDGDTERWQEVTQLRRDHRGWAIIWLAPAGQFRAYKRLPGARRDTALSAATAGDLGAQITAAEQAARARRRPGRPAPRRPA